LFENIENAIEGIETNITDIENEIGDTALPTTAQSLSGAIAEHESDISELNSNLADVNIASVRRVANTFTTGATGNIATEITNDGLHYIVAPLVSGANVFLRTWVSAINGKWYLTAIDPNTGATVNNTQLAVRYLIVTLKIIE
jgi:hypothetical protein